MGCDRQGIVAMGPHPERQGLDAGEQQEGVERRQRRAEIRRPRTRAAMAKAKLPKVSARTTPEYSAAERSAAGSGIASPFERAAVDDEAADRIAVAAEKLRGRMDDDVGTMFEGPDQIGRRQGIIDDQWHFGALGYGRYAGNVGYDPAGIGDRLDEDRLGPG